MPAQAGIQSYASAERSEAIFITVWGEGQGVRGFITPHTLNKQRDRFTRAAISRSRPDTAHAGR
jgi:hypothetical protein